ncbi:hypothetical protein DRJ48_01805 [Candidatus Woesearchaeota archaeon]|nr:MAG: hypothetical protein DRJ48_01805 [Candidatus Woesearchaeota archaeon]
MDITVGVCAYNEEANIGKLLAQILTQRTKEFRIKEVIVVSSGSTDKTDEIVERFAQRYGKVVLMRQRKRAGKYSAINLILKHSQTPIIVLMSGDILLQPTTVEQLCKPLKNPKVGICGSHPIPLNPPKSWLGFAVHVVWHLHHQIAMRQPKFGECIAFRRVFEELEPTAVDEEYIASLILKMGYQGRYVADAIIHNKGPTTIKDFIKQRRRIFAGHLYLKHQTGYTPPTMSNLCLVKLILSQIDFRAPFKTGFAILLEAISRALGYWDFRIGRSHIIWQQVKSTKVLDTKPPTK